MMLQPKSTKNPLMAMIEAISRIDDFDSIRVEIEQVNNGNETTFFYIDHIGNDTELTRMTSRDIDIEDAMMLVTGALLEAKTSTELSLQLLTKVDETKAFPTKLEFSIKKDRLH